MTSTCYLQLALERQAVKLTFFAPWYQSYEERGLSGYLVIFQSNSHQAV